MNDYNATQHTQRVERVGDYISRRAAIANINKNIPEWSQEKEIAIDCLKNTPAAQPERRWIPMSEREPEFGDYLTTYIEKETGKLGVTTDMYWSGGWDDDCDEFETLAWMPLPAPWRGEEHGE